MTLNLCLAPLKGVTDSIYRNTLAEFYDGIDWAIAPFVSTAATTRIKDKYLRDLLPHHNTGMPVVPQIMSKSSTDFIVMANALFDLGYQHINWNLGCPYPMVAKKGRGSGMLPFPELIESFLDRVVPTIPNQLSLKLRLGRHRSDEIFALLPVLERYPVKMLIIHPRTGVQMYAGVPDLESFERCLRQSRHTIIYNGDIVTPSDFKLLQKLYPQIHTWMIGRGVIQDPYLAAMIKGQICDDTMRQERFRRFHGALVERYEARLSGPAHLLDRMKCLWGYFQGAFVEGRHILKTIKKTRRIGDFKSLVAAFFDTPQRWRI